MDHLIDDQCTNCAIKFTSASQIFNKITVVEGESSLKDREIAVLDAILYIYGFSSTNLASVSLDNKKEGNLNSLDKLTEASEWITKRGLSMCSKCVVLFKELYIACYQLKKLSSEAALLSKAIKFFSPTCIKIEQAGKIGNSKGNDGDVNTAHSRKNTSHDSEEENSSDDLFLSFKFEQEYEEYEPGHDQKTNPLAESENSNPVDLLSSITSSASKPNQLSRGKNSRTRRAASPLVNYKNDEASDPEIATEKKESEPCERRSKRKRFLTEKKKEDARLILGTNMKRLKGKKRLEQRKSLKKREENRKRVRVSNVHKSHMSDGVSDYQYEENEESPNDEHENKNEQSSSTIKRKKKDRSKKMLKCHCGKAYNTLETLKKHEKVHKSQEPVVCDVCGESFVKCSLLYAHKSWVHLELPDMLFKCDLCGKCGLTRENFKAHQELKHAIVKKKEADEGKLKCSCGRVYRTLNSLRYHERSRPHPQQVLPCNICGEAFKKFYLLYRHKSIVHSELPEITFKCKFCDAKYATKRGLQIHEEENHANNLKSFVCDKCGKCFNSLTYLRRHTVGIHNDEGRDKEQFRCKECGILLKHSEGLKKHIRLMHRSQKTFVCEQCGKVTKNMTNMRIHMKVHDPNRTIKSKPPTLAHIKFTVGEEALAHTKFNVGEEALALARTESVIDLNK